MRNNQDASWACYIILFMAMYFVKQSGVTFDGFIQGLYSGLPTWLYSGLPACDSQEARNEIVELAKKNNTQIIDIQSMQQIGYNDKDKIRVCVAMPITVDGRMLFTQYTIKTTGDANKPYLIARVR